MTDCFQSNWPQVRNLSMNFLLAHEIVSYDCVRSLYILHHVFVILVITEADAAVVSTDYRSYLVIDYCAPNVGNCGRKVDVFSRAPFASLDLIRRLDRLVKYRLGLDPSTFFFSQRRVPGEWNFIHYFFVFGNLKSVVKILCFSWRKWLDNRPKRALMRLISRS